MRSQRVILAIGLAVLLVISAASIGLHVESRSAAAWVDQTLGVLNKISDLRLLVRQAESAARGFALNGAPKLLDEYRSSVGRISPAFAELIEATRDNPDRTRLLRESQPLVAQRLAVSSEVLRLQAAGDTAGLAALRAKAEGRATMATLETNFDRLTAAEQGLLAVRSAQSRLTGRILLAINLARAALILMLAGVLILQARPATPPLHISP